MTNLELINTVQTMLEDDSVSEEVVSTYLNIAAERIIRKAYPYDDTVSEVPLKYHTLQCEIACYLITKRGAEGQSAHTENGITRTYAYTDVPNALLNSIRPYCGVIK